MTGPIEICLILGLLLCVVGYLLNIFRIFGAIAKGQGGMAIVRIIGVFLPFIGIIAGYIPNKMPTVTGS